MHIWEQAGIAFKAFKDIQLSLAYTIRGTTDIEDESHYHHYNLWNIDNRKDNKGDQNHHKWLTSFDHLKNNIQNIEISMEFKL